MAAEKVLAVSRALDAAGIPHAVGGAIALGHYAEPRPIRDIDVNVFVGPERRTEVEAALAARAEDGPPVHLFFDEDPLHEAMRAAVREVPFADAAIPMVSPEHLVVRKLMLDRPKDRRDIEAILGAEDRLDLSEIRAWVERLGGPGDARLVKLDELLGRRGRQS